VSGFLPASESDLQRASPGASQPGALPGRFLLGGEKVLFEAHPRLLRLHPWAFWVPIPFAFFLALVLGIGFSQAPGGNAVGILILGAFLLVLPLVAVSGWAVSSAYQTSYALTDQRVIFRAGDESVAIPYERIVDVESPSGSSRVVFSIRDGPSLPRSKLLPERSSQVVWKAVPGAPAVASFARSASQFYELRMQQARIRQDLIKASMEDKVFCQYCGGYSLLRQLNVDNPRCPRCSAPIVVAPTGIF
jgi:hypothetical protein